MPYADSERRRELDRQRTRRRTDERVALGLCLRCGRQAPAPGHAVCKPCAEKRRIADRIRAAKRRAAGIRRIRDPKAKQAEYQCARARAAKRVEQGLCSKCGRHPHEPERRLCADCGERQRRRDRERYARARDTGALYGGKPVASKRRHARRRTGQRLRARRSAGLCIRCGRNRAFEILRSMMNRAEEWGFRERGTNPCLGIRKNPRRDIARFLDRDELARLGKALDAREARWPEAVAAIRLLALTGCRRGEVLNLRWRDIRKNALILPDSKTGPRSVPLGEAALAIVDAMPGPRRKDAFLFPKNAGQRSPYNIVACWHTVREEAKLGRLRLHDLRHTAASHAVMSGENLPLVARLLGHRRHETTAGYAHLADGHLVQAAEKIGKIIENAMTVREIANLSRWAKQGE